MQIYGLRIHIVLLVFVLLLGTAVGVQRAFFAERAASVEQRFLEIPGVTDVELVSQGQGGTEILVGVGTGEDLPAVHRRVVGAAREQLGSGLETVRFRDSRSPVLEEIYYRMHFAIQEAIATGQFARMAAEVERLAAEASLDSHRVFVDEGFVYLQLAQGEDRLYEVIRRDTAGRSANGVGGGNGS